MIERLRHDYGPLRVAVIDTDCHHGDGTQDIYWHDPDTLFISLHQDGRTLYPGSGAASELGGPKAWGATVNIPLPPGTGDEGFLLATREIVRPILDEWKPELVINSAGQDNHFTDPITNMLLTALGYAEMSQLIGPDIAVLEGGYAIQGALPYTNLAIILSMAGLDWGKVREPMPKGGPPKTPPETLSYVKRTADFILKKRQGPPEPSCYGAPARDGWFPRDRRIFYDSHPADPALQPGWPSCIDERREERLRDCPDCPGVLLIRSSSGLCGPKVFADLPREPCEKCRGIAEEARAEGKWPF
jgi:hypothetical protein